tara:strand:+ start:417 stop:914 length:498 start_codon:yes stop_codon:yes gene_type:complete
MRVFVALFVFIFFSQSVYSATYATCNALDYNNDKEISLKLTWNKIFLNENNEGLKEWKKIKYTNEEIVISKTIPQKIYKCDWMCQLLNTSKSAIKYKEDLYNDLLSKTPFWKKFVITVDRISGSLTEEIEVYSIYEKDDGSRTPYTRSVSLKKEYSCEASNKTKF